MATIIPKTPVLLRSGEKIFRPPVYPLEVLFAAVGPKLLKEELHTYWLSLTEVSRACQKYKIKWPRNTHKASEIEMLAEEYFEKISPVMKVGTVKVECKTEWVERGRRNRIFLKFHLIDPANDIPSNPAHDNQS